jgi:hypothetical protein
MRAVHAVRKTLTSFKERLDQKRILMSASSVYCGVHSPGGPHLLRLGAVDLLGGGLLLLHHPHHHRYCILHQAHFVLIYHEPHCTEYVCIPRNETTVLQQNVASLNVIVFIGKSFKT